LLALSGAPNAAAAVFTVTRTGPCAGGCMPMDCRSASRADANMAVGADTILPGKPD
jgi:hypothetical protein